MSSSGLTSPKQIRAEQSHTSKGTWLHAKKRPPTDISCTKRIQEFYQILYSIQSILFNERVTFRIWPSTTNCPVKSILQASHAIDKLFSICLIYYQNKHNLQWNPYTKKKKKSLKCKTFANTNFQTSTNTTNLIYKPKYYNFKLKQLFQTTQVHHIITNVQSSQQTHDRI